MVTRSLGDRTYELRLPRGYAGRPTPVVVAVHGFTHDAQRMRALTSPDGNPSHPDSLESLADREGFALVYPNGTPLGELPGRAWNAGGGLNGYAAVASPCVEKGVDDVAFFRELLADLDGQMAVDDKRVYVAGISNGAAMAHRLAMELSDRIAAVACVAGANQHAAAALVRPAKPVPVLQIHGTRDPIWPYAGGTLPGVGRMLSVADSVATWAQANGAVGRCVSELPDASQDGTAVTRESFPGKADTVLYRVEGGGHSWPGGHQFAPAEQIGPVCRDFSANEAIWEFFRSRANADSRG